MPNLPRSLFLILALFLVGSVALAQDPTGGLPSPIALGQNQQPIALEGIAQYWLDDSGKTTAPQIANAALPAQGAWKTLPPGLIVPIHEKKLWLRFAVATQAAQQAWWLDIPQPWLDKVTVNYQDSQDQWQTRLSGDTVPHSQWASLSRTPRIELTAPRGTATYYVSVEHFRAPYPVRMSLQADGYVRQYRLYEDLFFGGFAGISLVVVLLAVALAMVWRDYAMACYGFYFVCAGLTVLSRMGLTSLLLWPDSPEFNAVVSRLFPMMALAAAMWFLHSVVSRDPGMPRWEWPILLLAMLSLAMGLVEAFLPTVASYKLSQLNGLVVIVAVALIAVFAWLRGNRSTRLVAWGMLPLAASGLFLIMRNAGLQPAGYEVGQFAVVAGLAVQTPILLYAMIRQAQTGREAMVHAGSVDRIDPLTGLSTAAVLEFNLQGSLARAALQQHTFVLMLVQLKNLQEIQNQFGLPAAQRAMHSVGAMLRELRRGVDTAAYLQENYCVLLIEQGITPEAALVQATSLLVRSLQPNKNLPKDVQLQLRISLAYMPDSDVHAEVGQETLDTLRWMVGRSAIRAGSDDKAIERLNF